jgi:hypothetical protein
LLEESATFCGLAGCLADSLPTSRQNFALFPFRANFLPGLQYIYFYRTALPAKFLINMSSFPIPGIGFSWECKKAPEGKFEFLTGHF